MRTFLLLMAVIFLAACEKEDKPTGSQTKGKPPIADAGADLSVTIPDETCILYGGDLSMQLSIYRTFIWTKLQGPPLLDFNSDPAIGKAYPVFLQNGKYPFQLRVRTFYGEDLTLLKLM